MNLGDVAARAARWYGDREALAAADGSCRTFRELDARSDALAHALLDLGLRPADRVAVLMGNELEWFDVTYALAKAGLVRSYVNPRLTQPEIEYQLEDSGAAAFVVTDGYRDVASKMAGTGQCQVVSTGEQLERMIAAAPSGRPGVQVAAEDLAAIMYSSGTTGRPKGVLQTHAQWLGLSAALAENGVRSDDVILHVGPLSHAAGGLSYLFLAAGARQVVHAGFDPEAALATIERERVTSMVAVPTMIYVLLDLLEASPRDVSSMRLVQYGGAPIAPERLERCLEVFGPVFVQGYGLTENLVCTRLPREAHVPGSTLLGSAGRPYFLVELRIVDDDHREVDAGAIGEIAVRSPYATQGYWRRPEETAALRDDEGWIYTSDLGLVDEEGYLFLVDRKHDMIVSGGYNVYPREVEDALLANPQVVEVAVVGAPDPRWGEAVTAVVRTRDPGVTSDELDVWCRDRLAGYKVPKSWEVVEDELPKNPNGKILRRAVRERYWSGHDRRIG
jgi:acyl-CoA synthetase (AMP-forming)/AMP-acid ligase II